VVPPFFAAQRGLIADISVGPGQVATPVSSGAEFSF